MAKNNKNKNRIKLIENIKSKYITQMIFSYIDEKIKLKLVKNNKQIQNKLDITIYNYMFFNEKYFIFEKNGIMKEYNKYNDELIYEGEYLNGKRNGKGKEYDNGYLIFEGEYLNGNRWNGYEYDGYNNILYELKNGNGILKNFNCGLFKFEGVYLNGQKKGKGMEYSNSGYLLFEGEYLNGKRHGRGKEYDKKGKLIFEGEYFKKNRWTGKGYDGLNNIIYELKNGKGYVKEYEESKLRFEGEYLNGQKNGKGKEYYNGKLIYEGEYLYNDRRSGNFFINNKLEYEGDFLYNKKFNGIGYDENGNIIYELNIGNGKVKEYYDNGKLKFEGEYLNGKKNGKGKEYDRYGKLIYEGEYINGQKKSKGKTLKFEGNYLNSKCKIYDSINKLEYKSDYINDKGISKNNCYII